MVLALALNDCDHLLLPSFPWDKVGVPVFLKSLSPGRPRGPPAPALRGIFPISRPPAAAPGQPGPAPPRLRAAAKPQPDHAGRSCSGHAQWPGRWGRSGAPGPAGNRGAGADREVGGSGGRSRESRRRPRGAEQVGPRAGRAGMSNGIGQGGREGPAPESQVSGGGAGGSPRSPHPEEVGLPLPFPGQPGLGVRGWSLARLVASGGLEHFMLRCPFHAALEETLGVKSSRGHGKDELEVCLFPF